MRPFVRFSGGKVPRLACAALLAFAWPSLASSQVPALTGTAIVTNKAPATATIIDVASGATLATLPTGHGPHEIVLSRDGGTAVITDYGTGPRPGSTLTVIDVPARRVVRTIALGAYTRPHGLVFLPGDSVVAVTSEASQAVVLVHVGRGEVVRAVKTNKAGSHMVGLASDGVTAWTGDIGSNTITELDLYTGRSMRSVAVPEQPEAINVTPDGNEVWVGSNGTGKVSVVDTYMESIVTAAEGFRWPYRVLFTPDAETVLLPDYTGDVLRFMARRTRKELGRLEFPQGGPQGITVTADGRYALLSLSREARVVVIEIATRRVLGTVPAGDTPDGVVFTSRVTRP
jgi:DNA-binding beta-propeller fold protein YncE